MIKKLRIKFICVTMAIVTVLMCVIFGLVIHFTAQALESESIQMLRTAASEPEQVGRPGEVQMPCFSVRLTPWGLQVVKSGGFDLSDEELVAAIVEAAQMDREDIGVLVDYNLRYYRSSAVGGQTIVFADISSEQAALRTLTINCLLIGIVGFLAFLAVSFLLAGWMVKPVEAAWLEQRQFVADASHELKTPLTVIMTNAELLQSPDYDESQRAQFSRSILAMSQQMRSLVENLLDLARVDNGAAKAAFAPLNLSQLAEDELLPWEPVYFEQGLTLDSRIQENITVTGSERHLRQVLTILLDNARKYSAPEGNIQLELKRQGGSALLSVSNPGDPISREDLTNIFKRFYRVDKVRSTGGGYGLGLPIAQQIVRQHGGKIWAESRQGVNSFFVQIPVSHG